MSHSSVCCSSSWYRMVRRWAQSRVAVIQSSRRIEHVRHVHAASCLDSRLQEKEAGRNCWTSRLGKRAKVIDEIGTGFCFLRQPPDRLLRSAISSCQSCSKSILFVNINRVCRIEMNHPRMMAKVSRRLDKYP